MDTNCPNCGAPVNSDYVRCQYCGTPTLTLNELRERIVLTQEEVARRYEAQRFFEYPSDEERIAIVKDNIKRLNDEVEDFWADLIQILMILVPLLTAALVTFIS